PLDAGAGRRPPPDVHRLGYDTDLLALADTDASAVAAAPPDLELEAELAAFAAMAHRGPTTEVPDPADLADNPEEHR
ncbi:MAG: hypothetical protein ACRDRH_29050, partial [Pseudonocardia sp.]